MIAHNRLIVQVTPYYPPHLGGVEKVVQTIAETFARDQPVEVVTTKAGGSQEPRHLVQDFLRVVRCRSLDIAHTPLAPGLFFRLLRLPGDAIVHVHVTQAIVPEQVWASSKLRGRRFIAHFHLDVEPSGRLGPVFSLYKNHLLGRTLRAAEHVIVLTPDQRRFVSARYRVPETAISVISNGVGPEFFQADERPADSSKRPVRVLYVGRFTAQKNLPLLIAALGHCEADLEVVLVGDGELRESVERQAEAAALKNIRFVGAQYGDDLVAWYRWADAFVLASHREGTPLVLLEAMAAGLAVIATDVEGTRETVGTAGLLTAPDPVSLAAAIDRVALDPELRADLQRRARSAAAGRSWADIADQLSAVYARLAR